MKIYVKFEKQYDVVLLVIMDVTKSIEKLCRNLTSKHQLFNEN